MDNYDIPIVGLLFVFSVFSFIFGFIVRSLMQDARDERDEILQKRENRIIKEVQEIIDHRIKND